LSGGNLLESTLAVTQFIRVFPRVSDVDYDQQHAKVALKLNVATSTVADGERQVVDTKPEVDYGAADWSDKEAVDWLDDEELIASLSEENNNDSAGGLQQTRSGLENAGLGSDQPLMKKSKLK
jgi:hypothetical protein